MGAVHVVGQLERKSSGDMLDERKGEGMLSHLMKHGVQNVLLRHESIGVKVRP